MTSKGWNSHVHRGLPGKFESSDLSRDNVSRKIGRSMRHMDLDVHPSTYVHMYTLLSFAVAGISFNQLYLEELTPIVCLYMCVYE